MTRDTGHKTQNRKVSKVLVIGSGPIVIGQSAEFDYSGTQACKALREDGIEVILVNSNPATIQTDSDIADKIYLEPLNSEILEKIIKKENPEGILATVGGQTGLNLAMELHRNGVLEKYKVNFLGTDAHSIDLAESREQFNGLMKKLQVPMLQGKIVKDFETAKKFANEIGYPVIIRPSFTLGGTGGGTANNESQLKEILDLGFRLSATNEVLLEKSGIGWGEFEYEVIRDGDGNSVIICTMENFDPMGIHTGESIVAAPIQTLSDRENQMLRNAALRIVNAVGVKGSCNVQFSLNQETGEYVVIEINPRLSRSSALASKATGYPIARVAAKIALGKKLHEIKNPITGTSAAFEPALDYVVLKIPRWPFDKFSRSNRKLGTMMKSTGEAMAIGRTFEEALMKAIRSLDIKIPKAIRPAMHLNPATDQRIYAIFEAFRRCMSVDELYKETKISKWFLGRIHRLVSLEREIQSSSGDGVQLSKHILLEAKRNGFSDVAIADLFGNGITESQIRSLRREYSILPTYKVVDSCAGEFEALTPYYYSTYEYENEAITIQLHRSKAKNQSHLDEKAKSVIVIGSGPIRIGQGIEFDYCCTHAAFALRDLGFRSIIVNNNPETVSTDFDSSDRLYFEPLTFEDVMNIIENEQPYGVILQLGGQTSINLAKKLSENGVRILGTQFDGIDLAEDRERFRELCNKLGIPQPPNGTATKEHEAFGIAEKIGYPIVVRPSYVIAGRGMAIVRDRNELTAFITEAVDVSEKKPVLIDKYLDNAIETEVDAVSDGGTLFIGAIMEHIEPAGIHSGDANIVLPSIRLSDKEKQTITEYSEKIAKSLGNIGLINIQYAVREGTVYMLEANPRASRTVPFVSKAIGIPMVKLATAVMLGEKLDDILPNLQMPSPSYFAVKSVVFPFLKLAGTDIGLGPEMRSTGETMGIGDSFEIAYYKALLAAGSFVDPKKKSVLLSVRDEDKENAVQLSKLLSELGFKIYATKGTAEKIKSSIIVPKIGEGNTKQSDILELIKSGKIGLVINTPRKGGSSHTDGFKIRRAAIEKGTTCITNISTAFELAKALKKLSKHDLEVSTISEWNSHSK
ncbi:carbamoyl-phosphate synthase large subunit [Candidatus Micrarchaeota archaeon]|nr:carbamoyl-phosphate synthase large subunit [Candidatus Micrarchaeota archaeon]MBU1887225.1 carbamoyl-phosphate synthase large subunit [Candidatus Micrarchaeota archaeon]